MTIQMRRINTCKPRKLVSKLPQKIIKSRQTFKDLHESVGGIAHTRYPRSRCTHYLYTSIVFWPEKWLSSKWGKSTRIMSKPHAHLLTMTRTYVEFEKDRHTTVGGDAHIRYPLSLYFDSFLAWKMTKFKMRKSEKKSLRIMFKPHAHLQTMTKATVKFEKKKNRHETAGGVSHKRYPLKAMDTHTDLSNAWCPSPILRMAGA